MNVEKILGISSLIVIVSVFNGVVDNLIGLVIR